MTLAEINARTGKIPGFLHGFAIDRQGRAKPLPNRVSDVSAENEEDDGCWLWLALDRREPGVEHWLAAGGGLERHVAEALAEEATRPRCLAAPNGALVILRGIDTNPKSQPTDLISVRVWIEQNRVITLQACKIGALDRLREQYEKGAGPRSPGHLVAALATQLVEALRGALDHCEEEMDRLEDESHTGRVGQLRRRLIAVRHAIVPLRRYLAPQRDALVSLRGARLDWLDDWWRSHSHELADEVSRYIEDLVAIKETGNIVHDTLAARLQEQTNRLIALLSIGAAAFLPPTLLVGLLGVNVGGIPLAASPYGFIAVIGLLVLIGIAEFALFRVFRLHRFFW
jgi:zinc transporter